MSATPDEIERRRMLAINAIRADVEADNDDNASSLFVAHHLREIAGEYWLKHFDNVQPAPTLIPNILVLQSHWSNQDESGIDIFDFTLPEDVTNYLISVKFDDSGAVSSVSMEG